MNLAERLGGMTVAELAERMDERELLLWVAEDHIRDEERRDAAMEARVKAAVRG